MHTKPRPDGITPSVEEPDDARMDPQVKSEATSPYPRRLDSLPGEAAALPLHHPHPPESQQAGGSSGSP